MAMNTEHYLSRSALGGNRRTATSIAFASLIILLAGSVTTLDAVQDELPLVVIIATGGTIANTPAGRIPVDAILEEMPQIANIARIEVVDYSRIFSHYLTIKNELEIARIATEQLARDEVHGVVITIGSNTSDETAYLMSLLVKSEKPLVIVAAQRARNTLSEDASRNFRDAVRVAADPKALGFGAVVAVNQEIHPARTVKKTMASGKTDAWKSSPDSGPIGLVDNDRVVFYSRPLTRHTTRSEFDLNSIDAENMPVVDIVYSYLDADSFIIDALVEQKRVDGLVLAGFLTGNVTLAQEEAMARARESGVPVVMSTRGWGGRVSSSNDEDGRLGADSLSPEKARILLMMALTKTKDGSELKRIFSEY